MCPSTWAGTPESSRCGAGPSRAGQLRRTSSWLPPMPPEVTTTACARISKSPTSVRELASPRATPLGSRTAPRTPVTAPSVTTSSATRWRKRSSTVPGLDAGAHPAGERLDDAGTGAPDDVEARHRVAVAGGGVAAALGPADDREEADALLLEPGALLAGGELEVGLGPLARPVVLGRGRRRRCRTSPGGPARGSRAPAAGAARGCRRGRGRRRTRRPARPATPRAPGRPGSPACRRRPARRWPRARRAPRPRRRRLPR